MMSEPIATSFHWAGFLKKVGDDFVPCTVTEMAAAAGLDPAAVRVGPETVQWCAQSYGPAEAVEKVKEFASASFWSNGAVQNLQQAAATGITLSEEKSTDQLGQMERVKLKRNHYSCIQSRPLKASEGGEGGFSPWCVAACGLLIVAIGFCWYLEWQNATTLALGLTFLNLGTTAEEMQQRASALVFVLVVMIPVIAKVYEEFLSDEEKLIFCRQVFHKGLVCAVLLILTWGAMGWMNPSDFDPYGSDVAEAGGGQGVQALMAVFYVLQLSTFAIGTYGLEVLLDRCWFKAWPAVVDESDVFRGVEEILNSKRAIYEFSTAVLKNCHGAGAVLRQLHNVVVEDAEIRVTDFHCLEHMEDVSDRKERRDGSRRKREAERTEVFNQRVKDLLNGDNHVA